MTNSEKITLYFSQLELKLQELPLIVGNEVVNYSLEAFEKQGWDGAAWRERESKKDNGRAVLIKSGRLWRSIRVISSSPNSVIVGSDVIYAAIHNNGGLIERAPRSEVFSRNRFQRGPKSKHFGGLGAFKKGINTRTLTSGPIRGLTFKAYTIAMPQRRFLGITEELRERLKIRIATELKSA